MIPNPIQNGYLVEKVLAASPLELIRMLYEGSMSSVDLAIEMLHNNDIIARGKAITKAMDILAELHACLREGVQADFSATLCELYGYMRHRLIEAHARQSEAALIEVSKLLKCLYEGWLGVMKSAADAPGGREAEMAHAIFAPPNPYETGSQASGRSWQI